MQIYNREQDYEIYMVLTLPISPTSFLALFYFDFENFKKTNVKSSTVGILSSPPGNILSRVLYMSLNHLKGSHGHPGTIPSRT